ncbi:monocarboxylate transporter 12-like [Lytechinus pictus]|uniref:monocarboxylate transporter 12-like n=1 Tax=Lytechinus pictus TaxID=7653 RepID=UPI0030B9C838
MKAVLLGASCQRFGCRLVAIIGGVIGALSTLLASFSTQLWQIHVCSTIAGLAYGAAYFPSGVVIRYYFKKRLGMANGVTYAGIGAGFFVMAPLLEKLCSVYGWKGAMFIHAAINANFILCAVVLRRTKMEQKIMAAYRSKPSKASDEDSINGGDQSADSFCRRILRNIDKTFAISRLMKNVHFVTLCLVSILSFEGHMSVLVFTAPKLVLELGLSKGTASLVMSAYGISGLLSRALHGFLLDFKLISLTNLYILSLVISGIQPMFNPLLTSTAAQFALIVVYGIGAGIMVPTTILVCRKYVPLDAVPSAIGLVTAIGGLGNVLSTQLMGQLSDATGSFAVPFYISGAFFWLSAIVMLLVTKCKRFEDGDQDSTVVVPEVAVAPNGQEDVLNVKPTALTTNGYHQVSTDVSELENWESAI